MLRNCYKLGLFTKCNIIWLNEVSFKSIERLQIWDNKFSVAHNSNIINLLHAVRNNFALKIDKICLYYYYDTTFKLYSSNMVVKFFINNFINIIMHCSISDTIFTYSTWNEPLARPVFYPWQRFIVNHVL